MTAKNEENPERPPSPVQTPSIRRMRRPWSSIHKQKQRSTPASDDASSLQLPEPPSPYSVSASLLGSANGRGGRARPPLRTILQEELEELYQQQMTPPNELVPAQDPAPPDSSTSVATHLLPAVRHLKRELRKAHQVIGTLQQQEAPPPPRIMDVPKEVEIQFSPDPPTEHDEELRQLLQEHQAEVQGLQETLDETKAELQVLRVHCDTEELRNQTVVEELHAKLDDSKTHIEEQSRALLVSQNETARLQDALVRSRDEQDELQDTLAKTLQEQKSANIKLQQQESLYKTIRQLEERVVSLENEKTSLTARLNITSKEVESKSSELTQLRQDLDAKTQHCDEQQAAINNLVEECDYLRTKPPTSEISTQTELDPVNQRLERIRDASERAALVQQHRKELAQLTQAHEKELTKAKEMVESKVAQAVSRARADAELKMKDYKNTLEELFEAKVEDLNKQHDEETDRVRQEYERSAAVASEVVQAAVSEASTASSQLEMEVTQRMKLEDTVRNLESNLQNSSPEAWERETAALLESIQDECNAIFTRNHPLQRSASSSRSSSRTPSPSASVRKTVRIVSPTSLDRQVDETEELVRSLMGQ